MCEAKLRLLSATTEEFDLGNLPDVPFDVPQDGSTAWSRPRRESKKASSLRQGSASSMSSIGHLFDDERNSRSNTITCSRHESVRSNYSTTSIISDVSSIYSTTSTLSKKRRAPLPPGAIAPTPPTPTPHHKQYEVDISGYEPENK